MNTGYPTLLQNLFRNINILNISIWKVGGVTGTKRIVFTDAVSTAWGVARDILRSLTPSTSQLKSKRVSTVFPDFHRFASFTVYTLYATTFGRPGV